jgi:hypothetical protein
MTRLAVVKAREVLLDCRLRTGACGVALMIHRLVFQAARHELAAQRGAGLSIGLSRRGCGLALK